MAGGWLSAEIAAYYLVARTRVGWLKPSQFSTPGQIDHSLDREAPGANWTGFANSEEQYADEFVGKRIQPFWIEDEAKTLAHTNFIVNGRFKSHAVRDGNLITGQQQYSGMAAARLLVEALGV